MDRRNHSTDHVEPPIFPSLPEPHMSNHRPRPGFPLRGPAAARIAFRLAVLLSGITAPTAGLAAAPATSRQTVPVASLTAPLTPVLD